MRKSILLAVLSLVAIVAVACGGGNTANKGNTPQGNGAGGGNGAACTGGGDTGGGDTGGTTGGETAKTDPYALYKKQGRSWTTKSVMTIAGMPDPMISYTKMEVLSFDDKGAKVKMTTMDKDKKETYSADQDIPFATATGDTGDAPKVEMKEETVKVEAGEFECYVVEQETGGVKSKSWSSKKYPGLAVKMETDTMKMELVEFKD